MSELTPYQASLILNALPHVGPISFRRLRDNLMLSAEEILSASANSILSVHGIGEVICNSIKRWNHFFNLEREEKLLTGFNHRFVPQHDESFPSFLKEIYDTPIGLYWHGSLKKINIPCVAIVGTRRCTIYGKSFARKLAHDLASNGICVVSGLARGIDTNAHEGALEGGGSTIAVLGNGMDIIYPPENKNLYSRITENGAIISEFPYGRRGDRQTFPMRNRIIAGLCQAIVIVESDISGGSMITAKFAEEQNRLVFALPGRIDQKFSRGCNQLIRDGAILVTGAEDIVESLLPQIELPLLSLSQPCKSTIRSEQSRKLSENETLVYKFISENSHVSTEQILKQLSISPSSLSTSLISLEIDNLIARNLDGTFEISP